MGTRNFHWDPIDDCVLTETDQNANTVATYTHEPGPFGPLLSENRGGTEYYHHYDALGSTTFLTNDTGTVTDTFLYDAWGNSVARVGVTPTPYQWVGRWGYQLDTPTGGFSVRARTYQPTIARWLSADPANASMNLYEYSGLNPQGSFDPTGECVLELLVLGGIVVIVTVCGCGGPPPAGGCTKGQVAGLAPMPTQGNDGTWGPARNATCFGGCEGCNTTKGKVNVSECSKCCNQCVKPSGNNSGLTKCQTDCAQAGG